MKPFMHMTWLALIITLAGCEKTESTLPTPAQKLNATAGKHAHAVGETEEGPHGGIIVEWGDGEYHAEVVLQSASSSLLVYLLDSEGRKAAKVKPIKVTQVLATLTHVTPPLSLELKHDPNRSDSNGLAFVATHESLSHMETLKGNLSGTIENVKFSADFKQGPHGHQKAGHDLEGHPGGIHVSFAQGKYYAEAILHKGGSVHLFLFGKDLSKVIVADMQKVPAYIRKIGDKEFTTFELIPEPLPGDEKGYTSRFTGEVPKEMQNQDLEITIPALKVGQNRYHLAFKTTDKPDNHGIETVMPTKTELDEERQLYLTPGGLYTAEDIKANGNMTGSEKFKNFKANHDIKPKAGDKICPITLTKANPECSWIIGGKKYEFCCPPCVDEFVKLAKEDPKAIKAPEEYVKK
jgi:hypothetical protein